MVHLGLALAAFEAALVVALHVDRGWRGQLGVGAAGAFVLGLASLLSFPLDCAGCTPEIGPWLAALASAGWLAGVGAAALVHRRTIRRPGRSTFVIACVLLLLVGATVAYGRGSLNVVRWGCPSQAELERIQSIEDVAVAFARHDLELESIPLPVWLPPTEPAYRGAVALRYATPRATAYVLVCPQRCAISRFRFGEARQVGEQRWRIGMGANNNVPIWVTEADRRAGTRCSRRSGRRSVTFIRTSSSAAAATSVSRQPRSGSSESQGVR